MYFCDNYCCKHCYAVQSQCTSAGHGVTATAIRGKQLWDPTEAITSEQAKVCMEDLPKCAAKL